MDARLIHIEPAATAVYDLWMDLGVELANHVADLRRHRHHDRGSPVRLIGQPVLPQRIVDASRDNIRRPGEHRAKVRAVDAPALMHVHDVDAPAGNRDAERVSGNGSDLETRAFDMRGQ